MEVLSLALEIPYPDSTVCTCIKLCTYIHTYIHILHIMVTYKSVYHNIILVYAPCLQ